MNDRTLTIEQAEAWLRQYEPESERYQIVCLYGNVLAICKDVGYAYLAIIDCRVGKGFVPHSEGACLSVYGIIPAECDVLIKRGQQSGE